MSLSRNIILKVVLPVGILALSCGLVIATVKLGVNLSIGEQIVISLAIFTAGTVLELVLVTTTLSVQYDDIWRHWEIMNNGERPLSNIRALFSRILEKKYSDSDLFVNYFIRQFNDLEHAIRDAAERDELLVQNHHFETVDNVLSAFSGEPSPIHRYTWILDAGERLFPDASTKQYFALVDEMVRKRQIREVQALLIIENNSILKDPHIGRLLDFYKTNNCFRCKLILRPKYEAIMIDSQMPNEYCDFGIYGTRLMFLTKTYDPETVGIFVKNVDRVSRYINFFDRLWNSNESRDNASIATTKVSFHQLVEFDDASENEGL